MSLEEMYQIIFSSGAMKGFILLILTLTYFFSFEYIYKLLNCNATNALHLFNCFFPVNPMHVN